MKEIPHSTLRIWTAGLLLAALIIYPLSFGPACWYVSNTGYRYKGLIEVIYTPLAWFIDESPVIVHEVMSSYANLGHKETSSIVVIQEGHVAFLVDSICSTL